uniref:Uncharacterized protein n=1 Tax=Glossina palpalis gambiensis TaxID=67801 RepID=A0A1B0C0K0_9MUSC
MLHHLIHKIRSSSFRFLNGCSAISTAVRISSGSLRITPLDADWTNCVRTEAVAPGPQTAANDVAPTNCIIQIL